MLKEGGGGAASGLLPAGSSLPAFRERAPFRPPSGRGGGAGALPGRFPAREGRGRARRLAELGRGRDSCARGGRVRPMGSDAAKPGPRGCARAPGGAGPRQPGGNGSERKGEGTQPRVSEARIDLSLHRGPLVSSLTVFCLLTPSKFSLMKTVCQLSCSPSGIRRSYKLPWGLTASPDTP